MQLDNQAFRDGFAEHYSYGQTPVWDIGKPQAPFVKVSDKVIAPVLDIGCGTGSVSHFFALQGKKVVGIDIVEAAIERARAKTAGYDLDLEFQVKDVFSLRDWDNRFATVIDSGLLHVYADDHVRLNAYVDAVKRVLKPGGTLFLLAFKKQPGDAGKLTGFNRQDLEKIFANGWKIESLEELEAEVTPEAKHEMPDIEWKCWFAEIRLKA